jgi:hypothetical protein
MLPGRAPGRLRQLPDITSSSVANRAPARDSRESPVFILYDSHPLGLGHAVGGKVSAGASVVDFTVNAPGFVDSGVATSGSVTVGFCPGAEFNLKYSYATRNTTPVTRTATIRAITRPSISDGLRFISMFTLPCFQIGWEVKRRRWWKYPVRYPPRYGRHGLRPTFWKRPYPHSIHPVRGFVFLPVVRWG